MMPIEANPLRSLTQALVKENYKESVYVGVEANIATVDISKHG